jgi:hypothetical protein
MYSIKRFLGSEARPGGPFSLPSPNLGRIRGRLRRYREGNGLSAVSVDQYLNSLVWVMHVLVSRSWDANGAARRRSGA